MVMGKWIHRLREFNEDTLEAICDECGPVKTITQGKGRSRICRYSANRPKSKYQKFKKNRCEKCGFIAEHPCQLDVDHVDGNKLNNDIKNLQTLCANCHRLKTYRSKEYLKRS